MLDQLMQKSLEKRLVVVIASVLILVAGIFVVGSLPVDVFPDLTAPTVTIMTEAHGMAPEEVEMLVTFPIETAVNGASGVRRVRSNSVQGLSTIWVEFDWGTDIFKARQIVNEKMQAIGHTMPPGVDPPVLAPITSIMGEIMLVGLTSDKTSPMDLRSLADFNIRRRLLAVSGVAQILVYGGEAKQYQVQVDPYLLRQYGITLRQVYKAVSGSNINAAGGFFVDSGQEYLIRGIGRIHDLEELKQAVITVKGNTPVLIGDVADVVIAPAVKIGEASINNKHGVLLIISKQPDTNTLELTERLDEVLATVKKTLPADITLHTHVFRQADFIDIAVDNLMKALWEGAILVIIVLILFLGNLRTTFISAIAIPLSLIMAVLILKLFNLSINTMTLGGMAIAIGVLVDDAIIYVENVYRRLRQNITKPKAEQRPFVKVVSDASSEIRTPIAMATFIVIIVFLPLFFLSGVEGRMLKPLGFAYTVSIFASLLVAVTITPALSSYLFRNIKPGEHKDSWALGKLKTLYEPLLMWSIKRKAVIMSAAGVLVLAAVITMSFLGREFLPAFNEGTLNISMATIPGTSLEESDKIGQMVETILLEDPAVLSTARRTGRTELDEHSMGSHAHEMEVRIDLTKTDKKELLDRLRQSLSLVPGSNITIGQPISHRIDHMLSGTRATIAVKIFGTDLYKLRKIAGQVESQMQTVDGVVDLSIEQQADIPQVRIRANRSKMALYGLSSEDLDIFIDIAFLGIETSQVYEHGSGNQFPLVIRYPDRYRRDLDALRNSLIDAPALAENGNGNENGNGQHTWIPLETITDIVEERGPNYISRENVQRKLVVQANVSGRDVRGVVGDIKKLINENVRLPEGYFVEYGGQFESEARASRTILLLSIVAIFAILIALYMEFGNLRQSLLVMVNLPLALIGGVFVIFFTGKIISIASMVGFITLFGIAVRNGIMMISHYNHLMEKEGKTLMQAVIQGSLERLSPIIMTALTTGLALVPLALAMDKPGSEIQAPMSIVILGGLLTATFLNMIVIPVMFVKWGKKA
jgi:CzcA family heavy metal efflux pump